MNEHFSQVAGEFEEGMRNLGPTLSPDLAIYLNNLTAFVFYLAGEVDRMQRESGAHKEPEEP